MNDHNWFNDSAVYLKWCNDSALDGVTGHECSPFICNKNWHRTSFSHLIEPNSVIGWFTFQASRQRFGRKNWEKFKFSLLTWKKIKDFSVYNCLYHDFVFENGSSDNKGSFYCKNFSDKHNKIQIHKITASVQMEK